MTDMSWIAPTVLALGVVGKQFWEGHLASLDRAEAQRRRDATDAKVAEVAAATDEVKHTVDGHNTILVNKLDNASSTIAALKTEVTRLNVPGAESSNENPGAVSTDATGVNVAGEDRRKP